MSAAGDSSGSPAGSSYDQLFGYALLAANEGFPPGMIRAISGNRVTEFELDLETETATVVCTYPLRP